MSIQTRLRKQRYGELVLQVPTKEDLLDANIKIEKIRRPDPDLMSSALNVFHNPPIRDKYFLYYIYTVNKYHNYMADSTKATKDKSQAVLLNRHLVGKLLYYHMYPQQFGGKFEYFAIPWIHNALAAMRQATLKQKYNLGEVPTWNSVAMWSHGNEPFVKPMGNKAMLALAERLYVLLTPRMEYIAKRSGIEL